MAVFAGLLAALVAAGALTGCAVAWRRWRAARHETARVRNTFARYVPPSVVDVLLARKDERLFTGRAVRATVLVCRIRNFARFTEELTPEQTLRYLNEFYGLAGSAIHRHRGIIDNFLGDGLVGVFGVPLENPTQEDDALQAALDIVRHVVAMRERWAAQNRKAFTVGIGVNSGEVIAGDAGFRERREFTVVGPEAMFAHRLQEAAFDLNAYIVAARATCESLDAEYQLVPISGVPLAGVRRLLDAFVVRGRRRGSERFTVPVDALVETTVERERDLAAPPPAEVMTAPAAVASPAVAPPPAPAVQAGVAKPRRRLGAPSTRASAFGVPEMRPSSWAFPQRDEPPVMPDPPAPRATYEDDSGPPIRL